MIIVEGGKRLKKYRTGIPRKGGAWKENGDNGIWALTQDLWS